MFTTHCVLKKQFTKYVQYEPILTEAKIIYLCRETKGYPPIYLVYWVYLRYPNIITSYLCMVEVWVMFYFPNFDSILFSVVGI